MRRGKASGVANRDHNYWEPPRSALQLEGRVEEIAVDAPPPVPPSSRGQMIRSLIHSRRIRAAAVSGAVITVLAAALIGPLSPAHPRTAPSPAGTSSSSVDASASAGSLPTFESTYPPFPTPTFFITEPYETEPPYEPEPTLAANGWPVTLPDFAGSVLVGPDGTVYVEGYEPIGANGRLRQDWLLPPDGRYSQPVAFGSDGSTYVLAWPDPAYTSESFEVPLWAFDGQGEPRPGWPTEVPMDSTILPGPSGTVYVLSTAVPEPGITILGPNGAVRAKWPVLMPGRVCGHAIRSDGTLFLAAAPSQSASDCTIRVFSPTGSEMTRSTARGWDGLAVAADGTVVAWGYDLQPFSSFVVAQTRVAIIGADGLPLAGWPVAFEGTASRPAFGPDGTLYLTLLGLGTQPSKIVALDRGGAPRAGWPVNVPAGYGPFGGAEPPVIGENGTVYSAAVNLSGAGYILAFNAAGSGVPGWPYALPASFAVFQNPVPQMYGTEEWPNPSPLYARSATGGLLYLILEDRILALTPGGQIAPGWPYSPSDAMTGWAYAGCTPDGGLLVIDSSIDSDGYSTWYLRRWTASGTAPK